LSRTLARAALLTQSNLYDFTSFMSACICIHSGLEKFRLEFRQTIIVHLIFSDFLVRSGSIRLSSLRCHEHGHSLAVTRRHPGFKILLVLSRSPLSSCTTIGTALLRWNLASPCLPPQGTPYSQSRSSKNSCVHLTRFFDNISIIANEDLPLYHAVHKQARMGPNL
jgi:hypothetical protein